MFRNIPLKMNQLIYKKDIKSDCMFFFLIISEIRLSHHKLIDDKNNRIFSPLEWECPGILPVPVVSAHSEHERSEPSFPESPSVFPCLRIVWRWWIKGVLIWWWWWKADCLYWESVPVQLLLLSSDPIYVLLNVPPSVNKKQKQHSYNFFPPSILASIHCTYTQIFLFFFLLCFECMCEDWNRKGSSSSNILVFLKSHSEEPSRVWCTKIGIVCVSTFSLLCGL